MGRSKEVGRGKAPERPPFVSDLEDLFLGGQMIEAIRLAYRLAQSQITGQDDILSPEGDQQRALRSPRPDSGDRRQLRDELVVRQP